MSVPDTSTRSRRIRWSVPVVAALIGVGYLIAGIVGDRIGFGVFGLVLMLVVAAAFLLAGRYSETFAGLADRRDERINSLDSTAAGVAGGVVIVAVIVMFMLSIARGDDGSPYYQLGALGGASYVVAMVWLRFRR